MSGLRDLLWLGCGPKTCCYTAVVIPTGLDVWRIARGLDVPPWAFMVYFETPVFRRDAFALDRSPRRFRLALGKNPEIRQGAQQGCTFLLRTRTGEHRCGLGERRPMGCRVFPLELSDGVVGIQAHHGCSCRAWSLADVDTSGERALLEQRLAESEAYCETVARWNAEFAATPEEGPRSFVDYCEYLLDVYDRSDVLPEPARA
jgi:Fe-S-cluster containining protein